MSQWKLVTGRWGSGAGETDEIRIDAYTNTLQTMTYAHHEIHEGSMWTAFIQDASVASGNKLSFAFKTPNTTRAPHLVIEARSTGEAITSLFEDATFNDDDGSETSQVPYNRNRVIDTATTLWENQTTGSWDTVGIVTFPEAVAAAKHPTGTAIDCYITGSGGKAGGDARATEEWVLAKDTVYAISMESRAAGNGMILRIEYYEHVPKH